MNLSQTTLKSILCVLISMLLFSSCNSEKNKSETIEATPVKLEEVWPVFGHLVEVTTNQMDFEVVDEVPAGITTFRYKNNSRMTHFFVLEKLPEVEGRQMHLSNSEEEVIPVFQKAMDKINSGDTESGLAEFGSLPPWYFEVVFSGGIGLTAGGQTSQITMDLKPGYYVLECYVKSEGVFHSVNGMVKEIHATGQDMMPKLPQGDVTINISAVEGIKMPETLSSGIQTIDVIFDDQNAHENFLGHDINLFKINSDTDISAVESWINWVNPTGLITPAPAEFMGGIQEMPAGSHALMTVDLKPGKYAWISEVPNASDKNLLKEFTVTDDAM